MKEANWIIHKCNFRVQLALAKIALYYKNGIRQKLAMKKNFFSYITTFQAKEETEFLKKEDKYRNLKLNAKI